MERKSKKELLTFIEEQNKNLSKYKSRLHDIIESYKKLVKEKETLESNIKLLNETTENIPAEFISEKEDNFLESGPTSDKTSVVIQQLRNSLASLTLKKSRIENELKADRKNIFQQKEELEKNLLQKENLWMVEKELLEKNIIELRRKVSNQQHEREKEQQDHVLMLKELQNVVAVERSAKEKLEEQVNEMQQKLGSKICEKKVAEYEKVIGEIQNKLTVSQDRLYASHHELDKLSSSSVKLKEELEDLKIEYSTKLEEERNRADMVEEKLKLLTLVKEKRISNLEGKIAELSSVVGDHDKLRQQDQAIIQNLKAQLQTECSGSQVFTFNEQHKQRSHSERTFTNDSKSCDNSHSQCIMEINRLKEELEHFRKRSESVLKERCKTPLTMSDAKFSKEMKELKSRNTQLEDQLQACKSQLKLNEDYHNKITANLEKCSEEQKVKHKQQVSQQEQSHRAKLMELENQIQKQRERTLALLEEKDQEIGQLKSSYLTTIIHQREVTPIGDGPDNCFESSMNTDQDITTSLISTSSLMSGKKDGHILHYLQELSRKDVELSNLRHVRIKSESSLRKLEQESSEKEENYHQELEQLRSRIKLLEGSQQETNVEYLKNVVLRFMKCQDSSSKRHMVNAIATLLHFTRSEVQDVKTCIK